MIIGISVTLAEGCALLSRAIFTDSLFYVSRRGSLAPWDHGGEDPLLAMFRKLRVTWSIVREGKNAKGMLKGEEKRMK